MKLSEQLIQAGMERGIQKARKAVNLIITYRMLERGIDDHMIERFTSLSLEEVSVIKK